MIIMKILTYSLLAFTLSALMFALLPLLLAVWLRSQQARRTADACSLGYDYEAEPVRDVEEWIDDVWARVSK
jgi:hypothetical protein